MQDAQVQPVEQHVMALPSERFAQDEPSLRVWQVLLMLLM